MTALKVKNLDQVYATIKSLAGELKVIGWDASFEGVYFNETDTLLGWFLKNTPALKTGVKDLLIAKAKGDGNYAFYEDSISISTEKTGLGLLVVLKVEWNDDNGYNDFSGRYATEHGEKEITYLLKYED